MPNMPFVPDITGLGRLADTQQRIAQNRRLDMGALQNREMNKITLANARQEILQRESDNVWRQGLTKHMQQMPQGSNPYLHQRDFAMKTGRMDFAGKLDDQQFERIGDLMAIDPDTAIEVANNTIGVSQGLQFANTPDEGQWKNMYTATDPVSGELVRMGQKPSGEWGVAPGRPEKKAPLVQIGADGKVQTKGRSEADKKYAAEYIEYKAAGGAADQMKQVEQIGSALRSMESGKELSGPVTGMIPDAILKFTNPAAISTREEVEEVVQRNLREVLGAQFTENEGKRLIARAYNPNLDEKENAKRLRRLYTQMETAALVKEDAARYWEQNGTLTGWSGKMPTMDDFMSIDFETSDVDTGSPLDKFWTK